MSLSSVLQVLQASVPVPHIRPGLAQFDSKSVQNQYEYWKILDTEKVLTIWYDIYSIKRVEI